MRLGRERRTIGVVGVIGVIGVIGAIGPIREGERSRGVIGVHV